MLLRSPTAVQPVFDAIVSSGSAKLSGLYQFDGALIHFARIPSLGEPLASTAAEASARWLACT